MYPSRCHCPCSLSSFWNHAFTAASSTHFPLCPMVCRGLSGSCTHIYSHAWHWLSMWRVKWFCSVFFMMSILTASEKSLGGVQFCGTAPIGLLAVGFVQYSHNCVCVLGHPMSRIRQPNSRPEKSQVEQIVPLLVPLDPPLG